MYSIQKLSIEYSHIFFSLPVESPRKVIYNFVPSNVFLIQNQNKFFFLVNYLCLLCRWLIITVLTIIINQFTNSLYFLVLCFENSKRNKVFKIKQMLPLYISFTNFETQNIQISLSSSSLFIALRFNSSSCLAYQLLTWIIPYTCKIDIKQCIWPWLRVKGKISRSKSDGARHRMLVMDWAPLLDSNHPKSYWRYYHVCHDHFHLLYTNMHCQNRLTKIYCLREIWGVSH